MLPKSWTKFLPYKIWSKSNKHLKKWKVLDRWKKPREDFPACTRHTHKVLHVNYDSTSQHVFLAAVMVQLLLQGLTTREDNSSNTRQLQIHSNVTSRRRTFRPLPHTTGPHFLHSISPGFDNDDDFSVVLALIHKSIWGHNPKRQ